MNECQRLIRDFCALARLTDPEAVARGAPLDVGGVTCSITVSRHDEANALVLYCEFGAVPAGNESAVYQELLAQNFAGSPEAGALFGFSPVAKHVICMQHLRVANVTAQRLVDILNHLAEKALEWRRTYFLKASSARPVLASARVASVLKGGR